MKSSTAKRPILKSHLQCAEAALKLHPRPTAADFTAAERAAQKATGCTDRQVRDARALIERRASAQTSAPPVPSAKPRGTITAQDREIGKHLGTTEEQLQQAADLRAQRFGV